MGSMIKTPMTREEALKILNIEQEAIAALGEQ
jgi:hypothetical protein